MRIDESDYQKSLIYTNKSLSGDNTVVELYKIYNGELFPLKYKEPESAALTKTIKTPLKKSYYLLFNKDGTLFNPLNVQTFKSQSHWVEVNEGSYNSYVKFLETRNDIFYYGASRSYGI